MLLRIDPTSTVGLADQIAAQVRAELAAGRLVPGEKLPPAREVAAGLDVNMHTVLRAWAQLRDEGLLDLRRGRGAHVSQGAAERLGSQASLTQKVQELVAEAARLDVSVDDLVELIRKVNP